MNISTGIKQAAILAIGIIALGYCIKSGLEGLAGKDLEGCGKGLIGKGGGGRQGDMAYPLEGNR